VAGSGAGVTARLKAKTNGSIEKSTGPPARLRSAKLAVPGVPMKSRWNVALANSASVPSSAFEALKTPKNVSSTLVRS
jgi:hypothetical protein